MDLEELKGIAFENAGAIIPLIHKLEDDEPDKRKKEWILWQQKMNFLFEEYNIFAKFVVFKPIK